MAYADFPTGAADSHSKHRDSYNEINATATRVARSQTGVGQQVLTIFAVPKAFHARFKVIQTNAIRSWTLLRPKPEIILFGDDEGTVLIARELGCRHIPHVERNRYGTPLVHSIFVKAQEL